MKLHKISWVLVPILLGSCTFGFFDDDVDRTSELLRLSNESSFSPLQVSFTSTNGNGEVRLWSSDDYNDFRRASDECENRYNALTSGEASGSMIIFRLERRGDHEPVGLADIYDQFSEILITYERDGIVDTLDIDFLVHSEATRGPSFDWLAGFIHQEFAHELTLTDELFE